MSSTGDNKLENANFEAKIAEQAERFDEMCQLMKEVAMTALDLSVEQRNLLSVAFKNAVGARRAAWRVISSAEAKNRNKGLEMHAQIAANYRAKIEAELTSICQDVLNLLDQHLIAAATLPESKVFYYKMKGDYFRYISEFCSGKVEPIDNARSAYEEATRVAEAELAPTNPIRLGLALNFSVFYYEILGQPQEACHLARRAFDDAISELDNVSEESYRDSTLIMQLLRDNLTLWTSDTTESKGDTTKQTAAADIVKGSDAPLRPTEATVEG